MKKLNLIVLLSAFTIFSSCSIGETLDSQMEYGESVMADREFKNAIAMIELHKVRYGEYPENLSDLKHISVFHESLGTSVQYDKLDSGYELNLVMEFPSFKNGAKKEVKLEYSQDFWEGLGCIESNTMKK